MQSIHLSTCSEKAINLRLAKGLGPQRSSPSLHKVINHLSPSFTCIQAVIAAFPSSNPTRRTAMAHAPS